MAKQFTETFLKEMANLAVKDPSFLGMIRPFLTTNNFKSQDGSVTPIGEVFDSLFKYYDEHESTPTEGIIKNSVNESARHVTESIYNLAPSDKKDAIILESERYIKRCLLIEANRRNVTMIQAGEPEDKVAEYLESMMQQVQSVKLTGENMTNALMSETYDRIYEERKSDIKAMEERKLSGGMFKTGLHAFDKVITALESGDSVLFLGRSGSGKSNAIRNMGVAALTSGQSVLHFQTDAKKHEAEMAYYAALTNLPRFVVKHLVQTNEYDLNGKMQEMLTSLSEQGTRLDIAHIDMSRDATMDEFKLMAKPLLSEHIYGLACFDYLDEIYPNQNYVKSDNGSGEITRARLRKSAKNIVGFGIDNNIPTVTAKQTNNIQESQLENPAFTISSEHIGVSKEVIQPFPFAVSINATSDEQVANQARLRFFKTRELGKNVTKLDLIFRVSTNLDRGTLWSAYKSNKDFWNEQLQAGVL